VTDRAWVLGAVLVSIGTAASAQTVCHQRAEFVTELGQKFRESPVAYGLTSNGQVIEVLSSASGSWTMIVTSTDGTSCALAAGESWAKVPVFRETTPNYIF
jgi:hypothetical protein